MRRSSTYTDPEVLLEEIELLLRKGQGPCLSVLVNLEGDRGDAARVKEALKTALVLLDNKSIQFATWEAVNERLEFRVASFEPGKRDTAIGLFISADMDCVIQFPFKVNEGVTLAESFEVRDVLYLRQYLDPYFVLSLSHKTITLHRGHGESLKEIHDEIFPIEYHDDHEYARAVRGTSFGFAAKGFENDRSVVIEQRLRAPIHTAVLQTAKYLGNNGQLILCGPSKLTSSIKDSIIGRYVIAIHPGSLTNEHFDHTLREMWSECVAARRQLLLKEIDKFSNLGLLSRAIGIRNVWRAVSKAKGRLMLVERNYQRTAYRLAEESNIRLHPPKVQFSIVEDAVDDAIEKLIETGGKVIFAETGDLHQFQNIALILRYP
jgi:Bacterial archaeo-eukaryotic release factor family 3